MELAKNYRINSLLEFYQPLLTNKQNNYMQRYYVDDYSLGEISEEFAISRQAVYDNIRRTELILEKYETQLHLYHDFVSRNQKTDRIKEYVGAHYRDDSELLTMINDLEKIEEE